MFLNFFLLLLLRFDFFPLFPFFVVYRLSFFRKTEQPAQRVSIEHPMLDLQDDRRFCCLLGGKKWQKALIPFS